MQARPFDELNSNNTYIQNEKNKILLPNVLKSSSQKITTKTNGEDSSFGISPGLSMKAIL